MNIQNQWLFEAPIITVPSSNQEYYSRPDWETEWELQGTNPYEFREQESANSCSCSNCVCSNPDGSTSALCPGTTKFAEVSLFKFGSEETDCPSNYTRFLTGVSRAIVTSWASTPPPIINGRPSRPTPTPTSVTTVCLVGHTDNYGSHQDNFQLGLKRAQKVASDIIGLVQPRIPFLAMGDNFITDDVLFQPNSVGETRRCQPNSIPGGPCCNRRVEVYFGRGPRPLFLSDSPSSSSNLSPSNLPKNLIIGSQGSEVRSLQIGLNQWLTSTRSVRIPQLKVDGIFGRNTATAVRAFQQNRGLAADGIVGPRTWQALTAMQSLMQNRRSSPRRRLGRTT